MVQRIILIHGRSTKPAKDEYEKLQLKALIAGVARKNSDKAEKLKNGAVKIDFAYYGHINNRLLAKNAKHKADLKAQDPKFENAPCIPHAGYEAAIDKVNNLKQFTKREYRKVIRDHKDWRWLDEAATAFSTIFSFLSNSLANELVIKGATADMGAYLMTHKVASEVRTKLQEPLKKALKAGDDICLISHSMGCIVSYDVLWKFSRMSEYEDVRKNQPKVNLWMTLGCPLGEAGVKHNLIDGHEKGEDKFPLNIVGDWLNIAARDDFIAHDATMRNDYRKMRTCGSADTITDKKIYNCYTFKGRSNPHKLYGYLVNDLTGQAIADWIN
jgi:hypothetical protein